MAQKSVHLLMQGKLRKLRGQLSPENTNSVQYELMLDEQLIPLNPLIGQSITLRFTGDITCIHCNRSIKKTFSQGFCYPCFTTLAQCDLCILKPETCHFAKGTCRDPAWGEEFCFQPHLVYLANTSGIKVGITRQTQIPTRWIDQGAVQALPIFKTASRYLSGLIEVIIAKHISDKTSWQRMLKSQGELIDLSAERDRLTAICSAELIEFRQHSVEYLKQESVIHISYPICSMPNKLKSVDFDKQSELTGTLLGIKGQYLLLDTGIINIRKFSGYDVIFSGN